jgi:hypothetical protein
MVHVLIHFTFVQGCKRKFDVPKFVAKYPPAAANAARINGGTAAAGGSKAKAKK